MELEKIDGLGFPKVTGSGASEVGPGGSIGGMAPSQGSGPSFGDMLLQAIQETNQLQKSADAAIQNLASGKESDVAGVMTAVEKADLTFRSLMQVRNKLVDAYEELMRLRI